MLAFPHCKINIGLYIHSLRKDGYHNLSTVFYPLPLTDVLEVITAEQTTFHSTGLPIPGDENDNLCLRAYHLVKQDIPHLPEVSIHLQKVIPTGAGLGGGSADAAFMLRLLNEKYKLRLPKQQLFAYASALGSDCAFFLQDEPCYADGRGDELYPLTHSKLDDYCFLLVCSDIQISTAWAYSKVIPKTPTRALMGLIREPVETWKGKVTNDFEPLVLDTFPALAKIKETLYKRGALFASLSGTGAAMYALFRKEDLPAGLTIENARTYFF